MGVHDYICFVQRNGQNVKSLTTSIYYYNSDEDEDYSEDEDLEEYGAGEAVLVLVPKTFTIEEILSWNLREFQKFSIKRCEYSWDDWSFTEFPFYDEFIRKDKWWEQTIWTDDSLPDTYIVTFETGAYDAFVLGKIDQELISSTYYRTILDNRNLDMPSGKTSAYDFIMNSGPENVAEYLGIESPKVSIPQQYSSLYESVMKIPLFSKIFAYQLSNTPQELHHARLEILIMDNITCLNKTINPFICRSLWCDKNIRSKHNLGGISTYYFTFYPNIEVVIDDKLFHGCIVCGKRRCYTKYTCIDHYNESIDINDHNNKILLLSDQLINNLNMLSIQDIPDKLFVNFEEKGINYKLTLYRN